MADGDLTGLTGVDRDTSIELSENGYDKQSLAIASPGEICAVTSVNSSTAQQIIRNARDQVQTGGFSVVSAIESHQPKREVVSTGTDSLDDLLNGGVEARSLTEVFGNEHSGRSTLAHYLAARVQLPTEKGGLEGSAVYLNTRGRFDPERIEMVIDALNNDERTALANRYDVEAEGSGLTDAVLNHILVNSPTNSDEQILAAEQIGQEVDRRRGTTSPIRLVIVDSLTFHFRAEYQGRGQLASRQQKLNRHIHDLKKVCDLYETACLATNVSSQNASKSSGGSIIGHSFDFRVQLKKTSGEKRYAVLVDAPNLPAGEAEFYIRDGVLEAV